VTALFFVLHLLVVIEGDVDIKGSYEYGNCYSVKLEIKTTEDNMVI
jgi:hypothetical protein